MTTTSLISAGSLAAVVSLGGLFLEGCSTNQTRANPAPQAAKGSEKKCGGQKCGGEKSADKSCGSKSASEESQTKGAEKSCGEGSCG